MVARDDEGVGYADLNPFAVNFPDQLVSNQRRLIQARWAAGSLVLLLTAFCSHVLALSLPALPLYGLGVGILIYNTLLYLWMRAVPRANGSGFVAQVRRNILAQVVLDWISMAVFLHLTGGVSSPGCYIMIIHMLIVSILLPGRSPYVLVGAGTGVFGLVAALEYWQILPHFTVIPVLPDSIYQDVTFVVAQLAFFVVISFVTVFLTTHLLDRLREREAQIVALFQTTQAVSSTLSLSMVMDRLALSAAEALGVKGATIRLLDENGDRLTMTSSYGLSENYLAKGPVELSQSPLDEEALLGQPVIVSEPASDPRIQYPKEVSAEGIHSMLVVPIIGRGKHLGVLRVYCDQVNRFSEADAAFVMAIARQGAAALENALAHNALQQTEHERAQFVRLVTHELRAPVTGAQSLLRALLHDLAGELTDQQHDILGRLSRRLDTLLDLINDLLVLAASKTSALQESPVRTPLRAALLLVIDRLKHPANEKHVEMKLDMPHEAVSVLATENGLVRIFENLIGNAVKYTPEGGSVQVRVVERPPCVVVMISDTGIGIPEKDLSNLWQEFYRASNARRSGIPGTGLGLSIVKQLVDYYGGMVSVTSEVGKGTTFKITLSLAGPGDDAPDLEE